MIYTNFGGWKISKMMLGTVQLGLDYGIANKSGKPTMEKSFEILSKAIEGGVTSFDTAQAYGDSEIVLGNYFSSQSQIDNPFLTTKFMVDPNGDTDKSSIEKQIFNLAEKSMERLKIKKIPILMLHNAKDMTMYGNAVPDTLRKLKDKRLIDKAGVSVYNSIEVEKMLENDIYEAVQLPMNAFDLRMVSSGALGKLKEAGCLVFVRSVFLQGLFFMKPGEVPANFVHAATPLKQLHELAEKEGMSIGQLAISFIRDMEGITSLVLGSETPEQVEENVRLIESPRLSCETTEKIEYMSKSIPIEAIMNEILSEKSN